MSSIFTIASRNVALAVVSAVLAGSVVGCGIRAPVVPPVGGVYTNIKAPIETDLASTPATSRSGESSSMSILGIVAWGDASIEAAATEGGLKTIESADYSYFNILGIYQKYTTIVHGN